jgi:hypothetical protein
MRVSISLAPRRDPRMVAPFERSGLAGFVLAASSAPRISSIKPIGKDQIVLPDGARRRAAAQRPRCSNQRKVPELTGRAGS